MKATTLETVLAAVVSAGYGHEISALHRIPAGTATDNFRAETGRGPLFVKVYRPGNDLAYERAILDVTDGVHAAGIRTAAVHRDTAGLLLHHADQAALSVWQWHDNDAVAGPVTPDQAFVLGGVLAALHTHLRRHDDGSWHVAQPHYRRHTLNQIRQRFAIVAAHIHGLPQRCALDEVNLGRIAGRLDQLRHMPRLLAEATPPQRALVHGDYTRPNWLIHSGQVQAVIDLRLKFDDPVREIGRMAFDVATIATAQDWLAVAEAALTGYLTAGGIVPGAQFYGCARLALLHSLCSTYPLEELYLNPPPDHIRENLDTYWANRVAAVATMLTHLGAIDDMVARITRMPGVARPQPVTPPANPRPQLPVLAASRAHLQYQITRNAKAAGVKALLLWGSGAAGAADPLSDVDLIAVVDDADGVNADMLLAQLMEPAPMLFSRTVTHNGPRNGFYRGTCVQVAGWPIWADIYLWPAETAVIPADTMVLFDQLGLAPSQDTFWQLLDAHRAAPDGNPDDEPGSAGLLALLVQAKQHARTGCHTPSAQALQHSGSAPVRRVAAEAETITAHGIDALDRWHTLCTGLAAATGWRTGWETEIVRQTSKSTVARVRTPDGPAVVKLLTGADPYQSGLFTTELSIYEVMAAQPSPVPVLQLLLSGPGCLVLRDVGGAMLHHDRYPHQPLPRSHVRAVLHTLARFAAWHPARLPPGTEVSDLLHAKAESLLTEAETGAYRTIRGLCRQWCLAHGDAVPSNFLLHPDNSCTLIDFENTAWHLPGYDYAVLRTVLAGQPAAVTAMIDQFAVRRAGNDAYTANLIVAAAREKRLHDFFPPDPTAYRETIVGKAWAYARHRLQQHPGVQSQTSEVH